MKVSRVILFLISVVLIIDLGQYDPAQVPAQVGAPTLALIAPGPQPVSASAIDIEVAITGAAGLAAFEFDLVYDSTLVQVTGITPGPFLGVRINCNRAIARCAVALGPVAQPTSTSLGAYTYGQGTGADGDGVLATIHLQPTGLSGTTGLSLANPLLADVGGNPVAPQTEGASLTLSEGSSLYLPVIFKAAAASAGNHPPMTNKVITSQDQTTGQVSLSQPAGPNNAINPDVNNDGAVNVVDIELVAADLDKTPTHPTWNPAYDLNGNQVIDVADITLVAARWRLGLGTIVRSSPAAGESEVAVTRETILEFNQPLEPTTVTAGTFLAHFGGQMLSRRVHLSPDGLRVTLFYDQPLPASARVRVTVVGDALTDTAGYAMDADGDGRAGGTALIDFDTLSLSRIPNTDVWGYVYDSYNTNPDGSDRPVVGATIRVDGFPEANAITDENGYFLLEDMPAPVFFVHIDGSTATNAPPGTLYATVGKPFHSIAGRSSQLMMDGETFDIYLPPMSLGDIQPLSPTTPTEVGFGPAGEAELMDMFPGIDPAVWELTQVTFPPNSAMDDAGNPAMAAAIIPVPSDRLPAPLSPGLNHQLDIAVIAPGATNFDIPAPACFPNLPDPDAGQPLLPGEKSTLISFNHDTGQWEAAGSMTVNADGSLVCTDPGVGIRAPGWHGAQPGTPPNPANPNRPCDVNDQACWQAVGFGASDCALAVLADLVPPFALGGAVFEGLGCGYTVLTSAWQVYRDCHLFNEGWGCLFTGFIDSHTVIASCVRVIPWVGTVLTCGLGILNVLEHCTCILHNTSTAINGLTLNQAAGFSEVAQAYLDLFDALDKYYTLVWGSPAWTHLDPTLGDPTENRERIEAIEIQLLAASQPDSDGGTPITASELAAIKALPLPLDFPAQAIDDVAAYINLTLELWGQGIFTHDQAGRTDFLDRDQLQAAVDRLMTTTNALQATGEPDFNPARFLNSLYANTVSATTIRQVPNAARLYFGLEDHQADTIFRGLLRDDGSLPMAVLAPNRFYRLQIADSISGSYGTVLFRSAASGFRTTIPPVVLINDNAKDTDVDGLGDNTEAVLGTNPTNPDTDGDGVNDGAEIQQGTNPLDGLPTVTGIIAAADTPGTAVDICAVNDLAAVADSTAGVSVFSVVNGASPVAISQVDTPGNAQAVACAGNLVAVADGYSGLAVIDLNDPPAAQIIHQIDLVGSAQAVTAAGNIAYVGTSSGQLAAVDLVSGAVVGQVPVSGAIHDLALDKEYLYVLTAGTLRTVSLADFTLASSVASPGTMISGIHYRLFVGGGIAYATHSRGYNTFSLADPVQPVLIATGNTLQPGWKQIVANGSGLGVAAVGLQPSLGDVYLYDVSDPTQTNVFLTLFDTSGVARAVSIYNGLAYVADGEAGLEVINYLAYDALGQPPTISLSTNFTSGLAEEGKLMRVTAEVGDDVQVRNVEFYVDGVKVLTDGNFPFEHRFVTPLLSQQPMLTLQAQASDTGGNVTWTEVMTVTLVADATPPHVSYTAPKAGDTTPTGLAGVSATFSEPISSTTLTADSFRLFDVGPDGQLGTGDDILIPSALSYLETTQTALLAPDTPLPVGTYGAILSPSVADLAGHPLGAAVTWTFSVREPVTWISNASGSWNAGSNWNTGTPPQAGDIVLIDRPAGNFTITYNGGTIVIDSLVSSEAFVVSGGSLSINDTSEISNTLTVSGGTLSGAGDLTVQGLLTWTAGTISGAGHTIANGGVTITGGFTKSFNGRTLDNPGITTWSAGPIAGSNGAVFHNLPGGVFDAQVDNSFSGGSNVTFMNEGTVRKSSGSGTTSLGILFSGGTVEVLTGTLQLSGGGTTTGGDFTVASGAVLNLTGSTPHTYAGSFTGSGAGKIRLFGTLTAANATFNFPANLFQWESGSLTGVLTNTGTLNISNGFSKDFTGLTLHNAGQVHWSAGPIQGSNGAVFHNLPGGLFDAQVDNTFSGGSNVTFTNDGIVRKSSGTGATNLSIFFSGGTVEVLTGTLQLSGGGLTADGNFTVASGAVLNLTGGGGHTYAGSFTGAGAGTILLNSGTLIAVEATFDFPANMFQWTAGTLTGILTNTGTLNISNGFSKNFNGLTLHNAGQVRWSAGPIQGSNGAVFHNLPSGIFEAQVDNTFSGGGSVTFTNDGMVRKSSGTGTTNLNIRFTTGATVAVQTGTLAFSAGYTQTAGITSLEGGNLSLSGVLNTLNLLDGALSGAGTVTGNVANAGVVDPGGVDTAGVLTIAGAYNQAPGGTLHIELGGLVPGTEYDQLTVTDSATLDGTLNVSEINGFVPVSGDNFQVVNYGSHTGTFATIIGPYNPFYNATNLTIQRQ